MKKLVAGLVFVFLILAFLFIPSNLRNEILSPVVRLTDKQVVERPLERYYFENLRKREYPSGEIRLEEVINKFDSNEIKEEKSYTSWLFSYLSDGKKVTGMANIPKKNGQLPVVIMFRGYADDEIYFTGLGTRKVAGVLAENGFITLAPDFLGFGGSDPASADFLEARFVKPVTVLDLLSSIKSLPQADESKISFWAHSNGGQIALSVLEITQKNIPTVLWAPVTQGFPESVLQYMDDYQNLDELGKEVYEKITAFCRDYDCRKVSIDYYFQDINAPIQVHQGGQDQLVDQTDTDQFVQTMKKLNKQVEYFTYPNSDHNLKQDWDEVVPQNLSFFNS
ncbi:MAG: dienelactone hydrolase family protein [Patescibacteria group bacterium]